MRSPVPDYLQEVLDDLAHNRDGVVADARQQRLLGQRRGVLVEDADTLREAYRTGRGSLSRPGGDLRRLPTEDEVASAVLFLASPAASGITGQTLDVNCGEYHV